MALLAWREFAAMALPRRRAWDRAGVLAVTACGLTVWLWPDGAGELLQKSFIPGVLFLTLMWAAVRWDPDRKRPSFSEAAMWGFGIIYAGYMPTYVLELRSLPHGPGIVVLFIVAVKLGDSGAYFIGRTLGRHPLCAVSPKKTVEGAVASLVTTCLVAWIGARCFLGEAGFGDGSVLLAAVVVSFLGQAGDLIESLLKRSYDAKDSASVVPELGGALDMIDSLLFGAPALYFMILLHNQGAL
jgi:phosphatidate cytidylyltransferase